MKPAPPRNVHVESHSVSESAPEILDLNTLTEGPIKLQAFTERVAKLNVAPYAGKHVQLKGCAPTWAHLMVAGKLVGTARSIDFLLDDKKGALPIEVYRAPS